MESTFKYNQINCPLVLITVKLIAVSEKTDIVLYALPYCIPILLFVSSRGVALKFIL